MSEETTQHGGVGARGGQSPGPAARVIRAAMVVGAVAALAGTTASAANQDLAWTPFLVLSALGGASRFLSKRSSSVSVPGALVFVGAGAVVLEPVLALWTAALVGLAGLVRGDRTNRIIDSFSTLVLSTGAASLARELGPGLVPDQRVVGTDGDGVGVITALLIGVALTASWQVLRWLAAWIDRRATSATWQVQKEIRWLRDLTFAAGAVLLGVMWVLEPLLILLVLIPLLAVWRFADGTELGGPSGGIDPLTSTARSGMLRIALAEEVARSQRFDRPLSVLVADVDRMGRINKEFGHEAGDAVMRAVADRLRSLARDYDLVARIGGDSFALMLPECDREGARSVAERARELTASEPIPVATATEPISVSISVGVASFPGDAQHREELLTEAELAANFARLEGGNRIAESQKLPTGFRGAATAGRGGDTLLSRMVTADDVSVVEAEAERATMGMGEALHANEGEQLVRAA
ncbi:MAG TPA: GGDEF domain-containing protein, partial [Nitriliruptorales bacterium]